MYDFTTHRLRVFQSVVESGSFNAAARQLNITQPAISAHIRSLERELGHKLYTSNPGKTIQLTEAGKLLYTYARDIIEKTQKLGEELLRLQVKKGKIILSTQHHLANTLLPPILTQFSNRFTHTEIVIYSHTLDTVMRQVSKGEADLGIVTYFKPIEGLSFTFLTYDHFQFIVSPSHELAKKKSISSFELAKYPFVTGINRSGQGQMVDQYLKRLGIKAYNVIFQAEDYKLLIEMVRRGVGIGVLTSRSVSEEIRAGQIKQLALKNSQLMKVPIGIIYDPHKKFSEDTHLFITFLQQAVD
jgi:DNA-binding transcriptional LysR family regulator